MGWRRPPDAARATSELTFISRERTRERREQISFFIFGRRRRLDGLSHDWWCLASLELLLSETVTALWWGLFGVCGVWTSRHCVLRVVRGLSKLSSLFLLFLRRAAGCRMPLGDGRRWDDVVQNVRCVLCRVCAKKPRSLIGTTCARRGSAPAGQAAGARGTRS